VTASDASRLIELSPSTIALLKRSALVVAVLAVAVSFAGRRYGWLDYRPGGAAFDSFVSPAFAGVFIVSTLVALRSEIIGSAIAAFAAAGLVAFATNQLVDTHAALVVVVLAIPSLLWLIVGSAELPRRTASIGAAAVLVMAVAGYFVGNAIYEHFWGPTHPSSTIATLPDSPVEWVWSGSVTSTSGEVRAHPSDDFESVRLAVTDADDFDQPVWVDPVDAAGRVVGFDIVDLEPDTTYRYAVEVDGVLDEVRSGSFTTFPDGPGTFTIAVGSCARVGSNGAIFDTIRELDPLLYLITGDFHYGDNGVNDLERYREVMDLTLTRPAQAALYRQTPIAYVWDDHDYGPNDADGNSPSRQAAMASYREFVPSYELGGAESAVYQAFSVGRVRFVLTDARSARNLDVDEELGATSMLGAEQKAWFKAEILEASRTHELVVWVNPVPWVAEERAGADHWAGFPDERRELADHIAENGVDNLLMVSGDAHMLAIDDGTNTDYSTDGGSGFPLLHSAALDRPGSVKGGPYSEGAIGGGGQFATIEVTDDGEHISVVLTGLTWDGDELMSYEFSTTGTTGASEVE
jgi:PhoD-like phosphatase